MSVEEPPRRERARRVPDLLEESQAAELVALLAEASGMHVWPGYDGVLLEVGDMEFAWAVRRTAGGYALAHRNRGDTEVTEAAHYADLARLLLLTLMPYRNGRPRLTRFDVDPAVVLGGATLEPEVRWSAGGQDRFVRGPGLYGRVLPFAKLCRGASEEVRRSLADPGGLPLLGKRTAESLAVPLDREHLPQVVRWLADVKADWYTAANWYDVFPLRCLPGQVAALGGGAEPELALVEHDGAYAVRDGDGEVFRSEALDQAVRAFAIEWLIAPHARPRRKPTAAERAALLERFAGATLDEIERALAQPHGAD